MNGRLTRVAVAAVVAVASGGLLGGCVNNAPGDLSASAAKVLRPAVEDVRQAAASGTYADLKDAVSSLKSLVEQQQQDGQVSPDRATAIEDAADVLLQDARPEPKPTPTETTPSATPTTESPTPSESPSPTPSETESPSPSPTDSPIVSVSAGTHPRPHPTPTSP